MDVKPTRYRATDVWMLLGGLALVLMALAASLGLNYGVAP